ncbi:MAG: ABC transporter ATP-binding protein [Deltaproteobacteria bacterium]|nr:ABC transporter ATP-binding protein [Deltaproteobacteria bacterium]
MILRFEGVSYNYPGIVTPALDGLDLTVHPGENVLVAGSSGSGKSTFCRACIGLIPHFHHGELIGNVFVDGLDTRQHSVHELFRHAGLVFQNPDAQLFNQTVEAELVYGLESLGMGPSEIEKRLAWASRLTELDSVMSRSPHTLSGGEKQRVALGAILTLRPRLLLLDEPFTHLDPEATEALRKILRSMKSEGITTIIVEHRLHEIIQDVDRIIVFHRGRTAAEGPPHQVLAGEISDYGLNLPPLLRLFRDFGVKNPVFDVDEAIVELKAQNLLTPFYDRLIGQSNNPSNVLAPLMHPVVELEDLWFNYDGNSVLKGIDLTLRKGECVALLGRNGAGKTTLIKYLNGLLKPQRGLVRIFGSDTRKKPVSELSRHVSLVWQNPNDQIFRPTVREEVLTGPKIFDAYDPFWCDQLFDRFGLLPLLDRSPFSLSEGQKKRVSFAAALSVKPDLIVLDEPTAGQDEPSRRQLTSILGRLREEGQTILFVTHDLEFAAEHGSRWLILSDGKIIADGPSDVVMAESTAMAKAGLRPTHRFQLIQAIKRLRENKT